MFPISKSSINKSPIIIKDEISNFSSLALTQTETSPVKPVTMNALLSKGFEKEACLIHMTSVKGEEK